MIQITDLYYARCYAKQKTEQDNVHKKHLAHIKKKPKKKKKHSLNE